MFSKYFTTAKMSSQEARSQPIGCDWLPCRTFLSGLTFDYANRLRVRQDRKSIDGLDYHEKAFGKPPR